MQGGNPVKGRPPEFGWAGLPDRSPGHGLTVDYWS